MRRKKKPDLLAVLVIVVGLGVIATALAQGILSPANTGAALASQQTHAIDSAHEDSSLPAITR